MFRIYQCSFGGHNRKGERMLGIAWLNDVERRCNELPKKYQRITHLPEIEEEDSIVGTVPIDLRPLYGLLIMTADYACQMYDEHMDAHRRRQDLQEESGHSSCQEFLAMYSAVTEEFHALKTLFFIALRHELELRSENLTVKQDFVVVSTHERAEDIAPKIPSPFPS